MLPSRGLIRTNPASVVRNSCSGRTQPVRPLQVSIRHFSRAQPRSRLTSVLRDTSCASLYSARQPRLGSIGVASSVFAHGSGASRNLSLWPFGSKQQPTPPTETPAASETPTETETILPDPQPPQEPVASAATSTPDPVNAASTTTPTTAPIDPSPAQCTTDTPITDIDLMPVSNIPEQIGYLKHLGLEYGYGPTAMCEWLLEHIYVYSGLPWWATFAAVALLFRGVMFKPTLTGSKHQFLMAQVQQNPEFMKAKAEYQDAAYRLQDRSAQMLASQRMKAIMQQTGAQFWRPFVSMLTLPFTFGMFRLTRAMCAIPVPSLETGGFAWFTDLTVQDPFYILPVLSVSLAMVAMKQMQAANAVNPSAANTNMQKGMMWVLPPLMFLGTAWLPAALQWFFFTFSVTSIGQTWATLNPRVRRWAGLPPLPRRSKSSSLSSPGPAAIAAAKVGWQAPRSRPSSSISRTTAPTSSGSGSSSTHKPVGKGGGLLDGVKKDVGEMGKSVSDKLGASAENQRHKAAEDYEKRRAREEREKAERRLEELRWRKQGRRD
ncbi:60Kd inner membrane protein-domain-containing protein [Whalleya microplaca]|nr:60Kd inner membrane protein-domain-containing protein [Whalleya microplaca]